VRYLRERSKRKSRKSAVRRTRSCSGKRDGEALRTGTPKKMPELYRFENRMTTPTPGFGVQSMSTKTAIRTKKEIIDPLHRFRLCCVRSFIALLLLLGAALPATAQKYDQKKDSDMVTKDGADYMRIETKGCGFGQTCAHHVYDAAGNKVIIVTIESFKDPAEVKQSNPSGNVTFSTYIFPTLDKKAEYAYVRAKAEKLAKDIDSNELIQDGLLNEEAVNEFVLVNGMKFSQQRDGIIRVISR